MLQTLGFYRSHPDDYGDYRMLSDDLGAQVHLQRAVEGWLVAGRNPFGIYLYTSRVDVLARLLQTLILEPAKVPEDKPWGMYEFSLNGPDDLLVRVGWPTRLR